ncbi:MAG: hypothetical protein FJ280_00170 [Planctomycetes bacterium]|nr:hypothetical protein [Planctomycetota bacterium]
MGLLLLAGVLVAVAALGAGRAASEPVQGTSEIEQLRKEVADLRQRVESLEQQFAPGVRFVLPADGKTVPGVIDPYQGLRQVPSNWKRFEFNGMPYYVCPIEDTRQPAPVARKQTPAGNAPAAPQADDKAKP